jgi:hypothetical protein
MRLSNPPIIVSISLSAAADGNFTVAHGLGLTPSTVLIQMLSDGRIWFQATPYDATNLYLVASDPGIIGNAVCIVL